MPPFLVSILHCTALPVLEAGYYGVAHATCWACSRVCAYALLGIGLFTSMHVIADTLARLHVSTAHPLLSAANRGARG